MDDFDDEDFDAVDFDESDDGADASDAEDSSTVDTSPNGLSTIIAHLTHAIDSGHPAQGYLITGPVREVGAKLTTWIASKLLCTASSEQRPCGMCTACHQVASRTFPDLHCFAPEKISRIIDTKMMRERIIPQAEQSALCGGWKIFVISWANRMHDSAANALLKTLEEPPPQTLFILLAENTADMLPTIISRCQLIDAGRNHLLAEPWRSQVLQALAAYENPGPIAANFLASSLSAVLAECQSVAEKAVKSESKANKIVTEDDALLKALIGARYKEYRDDVIQLIFRWMQDMMRLKAGGNDVPLNFPAHRSVLLERTSHHPLARLLENLTMTEEMVSQINRNMNESMILPYWIDRFFL